MNRQKSLLFVVSWLCLLALLTALTGCTQSASVSVEIAYRNHPPVREVLVDVDKLLGKYEKLVKIERYDIDTPEGEAFLKRMKITEPSVLAVFINGSLSFQQGEQQVQFVSFPVGKGTAMTQAGNWTLEDLDAALAQATASK